MVVNHGDDYLSPDIYAVVIVPAIFRGRYAKTAEDVFRLGDVYLVRSAGGPGHEVFRIVQDGFFLSSDRELVPDGLGCYGYHVERLVPAAVEGRLQAQSQQFPGQVAYGLVLELRHGLAAAEIVRRYGLYPAAKQGLVPFPGAGALGSGRKAQKQC